MLDEYGGEVGQKGFPGSVVECSTAEMVGGMDASLVLFASLVAVA